MWFGSVDIRLDIQKRKSFRSAGIFTIADHNAVRAASCEWTRLPSSSTRVNGKGAW
jgi:hypothetical protein